MKRKSKSQSFLEYAFLIAVVVGAVIAMRIFMTRSVQEKFRQGADIFGQGEQFARGVTDPTSLDDQFSNSPVIPAPEIDRCAFVVAQVQALEEAINDYVYDYTDLHGKLHVVRGLLGLAKDYGDRATEIEALISGAPAATQARDKGVAELRNFQQEKIREAEVKQAQIDDFKERYPQCFPEGEQP